MKKIMIFGTFDIIHPGHIFFLKNAKEHGELLYVVVARDSTVKTIKGKAPINTEKQRLKSIQKLGIACKVLLGNKTNKYSIIKRINPDIICLGYDQYSFTKNLKQELKKRNINAKVIRLKAYKKHLYKSSKLRT